MPGHGPPPAWPCLTLASSCGCRGRCSVGGMMRNCIRRAALLTAPAALGAVLVSGCSTGEAPTGKPKATASANAENSAASRKAVPVPTLKPGQSGTFGSGAATMQATVVSVKYPTPAELGRPMVAAGRYALIRLTVKNTGKAAGEFSATLATWENAEYSPVEADAQSDSNGFAKLNRTYKPGQLATGNVVLHVGAKGGTATFLDATGDPVYDILDPQSPLFKVAMPR